MESAGSLLDLIRAGACGPDEVASDLQRLLTRIIAASWSQLLINRFGVVGLGLASTFRHPRLLRAVMVNATSFKCRAFEPSDHV